MKTELKEVYWGRNYPKELTDGELTLKRKNWGRRLIYDVYLYPEERLLGTCHVMEKEVNCKCNGTCTVCKCQNEKYVVKELVPDSLDFPDLKGNLGKITEIIRKKLV